MKLPLTRVAGIAVLLNARRGARANRKECRVMARSVEEAE